LSAAGEALIGLAMAVGLVGVIVPVLPGLLLIAAAAVVWAIAEGTATAWSVVVAMIAVLALGTYLKYRVPGRALKQQQVSRRTWVLVAVGGVVGFIVMPVIGVVFGVVAGCYIGEWLRHGAHGPAWASTKRVMVGIGKGMAIEFVAGIVAIALWFGVVVAS
jgi:uncharacterized protein YqgC (DUF456 family)